MLCKFRLGDVDPIRDRRVCPLCEGQGGGGGVRVHILKKCEGMEDVRGGTDFEVSELGVGEPGWVREVVQDARNKARIQRLGIVWMERVDR